jgi:phospholipid N-methyltransferase
MKVASVIPSSRSLAHLITTEINHGSGRVVELGPGTGAFTRALLERGVRECDLILIEQEAVFADMVARRFPKATTLAKDAANLRLLDLGRERIGAVVSGLPLLSMPQRKVIAILSGSFRHIGRGGSFYQFTYGPRCPVPRSILDRLGLKATLVGCTVQNLPPASVYRISRRGTLQLWMNTTGSALV